MFKPTFANIPRSDNFIYASSTCRFYAVTHEITNDLDAKRETKKFDDDEFFETYKKVYHVDLDRETMTARSPDFLFVVKEVRLLTFVNVAPDDAIEEINEKLYKITGFIESKVGQLDSAVRLINPILASLTHNALDNHEQLPEGRLYAQEKLDGNRLLIHLGSRTAYTRNHKITYRAEDMTRIWPMLETTRNIYNLGIHLDGELYKPKGQSSDVSGRLNMTNRVFDGLCYNVFCFFDEKNPNLTLTEIHESLPSRLMTKENKAAMARRSIKPDYSNMKYSYVNFVYTLKLFWPKDHIHVDKFYNQTIHDHVREGLMIYVGKDRYPNNTTRSSLFKIKAFDEIDLTVVGIEDSKAGSKEEGCAVLVVDVGGGKTQRIRPSLTLDQRRVIFQHPEYYIGKVGVFRYSVETMASMYRDITFVCWKEDQPDAG